MAGYALKPSGTQLGGSLRRIATILSATGSVGVFGFSGPRNLPQPLHPLNGNQTEQLFSTPTSFGGNTPLQAILERLVTSDGPQSIVCVTDGMENGGAIEKLAVLLTDLALKKWEIGIAAMMLPFEGVYYTEGVIPPDFLAQIRQGLPNHTWSVRSITCERPGTCYFFKGQRPLLFLLFSRTTIDPLFKAVRLGLNENKLDISGDVQLAPVSHLLPQVLIDAPHATRQQVRLPSSATGIMVCSQPDEDPLHVIVRLSPAKIEGWPRPSRVVLSAFRTLEQPGWVAVPPKTAEMKPDGSTELDFQIRCLNQGSFFSNETTLKGTFRLELQPTFEVSSIGWWSAISAPNPWQYPFKTYKLDYLTRQIHLAALQQAPLQPVRVSLDMKVRH